MVLDIADRARPKLISTWRNSPPYNGFAHTVLPLFGRDLLVVTDESVQDDGADWPKLVWLLDARDEKTRSASRRCPVTGVKPLLHAGGRCRRAQRARESAGARRGGARKTTCSAPFSTPVCGSTTCAIPISRARWRGTCRPRPKARRDRRRRSTMSFVDDRGIVFAVDRHAGGLYALEMKL